MLICFSMSDKEKLNYSEVVTAVVEDDKYFKDAVDWYCLKYMSAISERTFFIVLSIMSFIIVIMLYMTIDNILPLKEDFPVLVTQKDSANYFTTITSVKPKNLNYNSNEAILRLLLIRYVRELFTHNYKTGKIEELNIKLDKVKNYSTDEVMQKFRADFNQTSANMFNKNIEQRAYVKAFKFREKQKDNKKEKKILKLIGNYIFTKKIPTEAELEYEIHTIINGNRKIQNYKIMLDFKYEPVKYNNFKNSFTKPVLVVTNYNVIDK